MIGQVIILWEQLKTEMHWATGQLDFALSGEIHCKWHNCIILPKNTTQTNPGAV